MVELSSGAKIGIGVGVGVIVLIAIILIIVLLGNNGDDDSDGPDGPGNKSTVTNSYLFFPDDTYRYWDPSGKITEGTDLQGLVDDIFEKQRYAEFATNRVLFMLSPGVYNLRINVGYYTSITGLADTPAGCVVHGSIEVPNNPDVCIGALDNFFRNMSNLTIDVDKPEFPARTTNYFRVSQASPIRSVIVNGSLYLAENQKCCEDNPCLGGYASGGFMADCAVTGVVGYATQQQFFSRNSSFAAAQGGAWNLYYMGCTGDIGETECHTGGALITKRSVTPGLMASAPRFHYDTASDTFSIIKPGLYRNGLGTIDHSTDTILTDVYIAKSTTTVKQINEQLAHGVHVVFSPGVYKFEEPVVVSKSNTVVLGLAFATIQPTAGKAAIVVDSNAVGVHICGLILEAGQVQSPVLCEIGQPSTSDTGDPLNPTIIYDIFARVGGPTETASALTMVEINQDHVIIDHMWAWRADHTSEDRSGLGVNKAVCNNGLVIRGEHVKAFAIFAEHALQNNVLWEGERGQLYFQQTELPYDVVAPYNYPGLKVVDTVNSFVGDAIGVYSFFATKWNNGTEAPMVTTAIVTPDKPDIEILSCFTVFLDAEHGAGSINSIINDTGSASDINNVSVPQWCRGGGTSCTQCPISCTENGQKPGFPFCGCRECCDPNAKIYNTGGDVFKCYESLAVCNANENDSCVEAGTSCTNVCSGIGAFPFPGRSELHSLLRRKYILCSNRWTRGFNPMLPA